jgi:hypothetical protein
MPVRTKVYALALVFALGALAIPSARADIVLGAAANYGILVEPNVTDVQFSNATINPNFGLGTGVPSFSNTSGTVNGNIDFADSTGTVQKPNPPSLNGTISHNVAAVTAALNSINTLSATYASETGKSITISVGNGADQTVNAISGTLDPAGNRVFTLSGPLNVNSNSQAHGLHIVGSASDFVIFNYGQLQETKGLISLEGGITSDHVLFNYTGTANWVNTSNNLKETGMFWVPHATVTWDSVTLDGRLFGGKAGHNFQINSGFNLDQPTSPVPEPSILALVGIAGLGGLGVRAVRRRAVAV